MALSLLRHRDFGLLWFAGLISLTGTWVLSVALPITVYEMTGSPAATSAIVAVNVGTRLVFGAVAGVYVDRWDRRRAMIWSNVLLAVALLPALTMRIAVLYGVACAVAILNQIVQPAEHALLPRLVAPADLAAANSLNALNNNLARLVGPALGGVIAELYGLRGAILADIVSFAIAAALVALIRGRHRATRTADVLHRELVAGLRAIRASRILRALFACLLITAVGEGVMASLFAVFVSRELRGGTVELGALMSGQAVGGIVGGFVAAWLAGRWTPVRMVAVGLTLFGAVDLVIFNYPRWFTAVTPEIVLMAVVGIPGGVLLAGALTLLQTEVADELRGRVFGAILVVESGAMLVGSALAVVPLGVVTLLTVQGLGYVVAGVVFGVLTRSSADHATGAVELVLEDEYADTAVGAGRQRGPDARLAEQ